MWRVGEALNGRAVHGGMRERVWLVSEWEVGDGGGCEMGAGGWGSVEENKQNNKMAQSANLARSNNITRSRLLDKKSIFIIIFKNLFLAENQQ